MKKIKLFFVAHLPFWAALMGLQAVSTDASAQNAPKTDVKAGKVSTAAKAKVAVKAASVKNANDAGVFVKEDGPSFVKSGSVVKGAKDVKAVKAAKDVNAAASFVKEEGPSFVKSGSGAVKGSKVDVKAAATKAQH